MTQAIWNGTVIAESDDTIVVEGNHYFPLESVDSRYLVESDHHTVCPWKGAASYHTLGVDGERNENAAWYYPRPSPLAKRSVAVSPSGTASRSSTSARASPGIGFSDGFSAAPEQTTRCRSSPPTKHAS